LRPVVNNAICCFLVMSSQRAMRLRKCS
jgi:hypothetical protein